jgi:hypothetical protein
MALPAYMPNIYYSAPNIYQLIDDSYLFGCHGLVVRS